MSDDQLRALRFPVALVLSIVCLAAPAWADFKAGENAYHRGDYATAMREWQPLAKQGHAVAQYNLGLLYANGQGVQTMLTRDSGSKKLPSKDTRTPRSTWGAYMIMDGVFRRISRWL